MGGQSPLNDKSFVTAIADFLVQLSTQKWNGRGGVTNHKFPELHHRQTREWAGEMTFASRMKRPMMDNTFVKASQWIARRHSSNGHRPATEVLSQ
jgi:hypothetical protein